MIFSQLVLHGMVLQGICGVNDISVHFKHAGAAAKQKRQLKSWCPMQAWADNLLLTARKVNPPVDRRRDGSQESCTCTALHNLQQELGMAHKKAPGEW